MAAVPNNFVRYFVLLVCIGYFPGKTMIGRAAPLVNVGSSAEGAIAIADSAYGRYGADQAIDGKIPGAGDPPDGNRWHSGLSKSHPHWVWIRFKDRARIEEVVIHRADFKNYPIDFVGEYSPDGGVNFFALFSATNNQMSAREFSITNSFTPKVTDNFRLRILRSSQTEEPKRAQVSEIQALGEFVGGIGRVKNSDPGPSVDHRQAGLKPCPAEGVETTRRDGEIEFRSKWLRIGFSTKAAKIAVLCWDGLGDGKVNENFLKSTPAGGVALSQAALFPEAGPSAAVQVEIEQNVVRYSQVWAGGVEAHWEIRVEPKAIRMLATLHARNPGVTREPLGIRFAFDPAITPISPLPNPKPNATAPLPLLLHAADYGTLLVQAATKQPELCLIAELGLRAALRWDAVIRSGEPPRPSDGLYAFSTTPSQIRIDLTVEAPAPLPSLTGAEPRLRNLPRSWLNVFQYKADAGVLANNPLSDNAVQCMFTYTDPAVYTPTLPGTVEVINLARESLDQYFSGVSGYGVGHEDTQTDIYPSLLIAAWDVIRVTGDLGLLKRWLPTLEKLAAKAMAQDRNGNGLPESTRTGLSGKFTGPTGNWWDQINFGHEDAYVCALSYRAFRDAADLERLARHPEQGAVFDQQAERIRAAYVPNFLNPKTGVIAGWKDSKGELHDYWFVFINGLAIAYGLVPDSLANSIIDALEAKMKETGYNRFNLGLPGNLAPIAKSDYGQAALGSPQKEDGSDTFGVFENGGATACYAYFYIQALYQLGRYAEAERIFWPMMETFAKGGFQNGIGHGGEWRHWDGRPSGFEGFLADGYYAQMALFTGHYGIAFGPEGFRLEKWSPLKGQTVPLGLKYMGKTVETVR